MRFLRSAIVLLAICLPCVGQQPEVAGSTENVVEVAPYKLVQIQAKEGQFVWVLPWSGDWEEPPLIELHTLESGNIGWVGPPGRYAILWHHDGGQGQSYVVIQPPGPVPPPGPEPDPPSPPEPEPTPRPDGFAGQVYDSVPDGDPATTQKIADNYQSVATQIRAGGIKTALEARNELFKLNGNTEVTEAWKPFATLVTTRIQELASDPKTPVATIADYCEDVVEGLEATL